MLTPGNPPGRIVDFVRSGKIQLQVDERIVAEYDGVLSRPKFRRFFSLFEKDLIMDFIRADSEWHVCTRIVERLPDAKDACFLEVAYEARVSLVTGNLRHYPEEFRGGVEVLSPAEFLNRISEIGDREEGSGGALRARR
jgi:putative PIN family toxin of toxin-antitoxin system